MARQLPAPGPHAHAHHAPHRRCLISSATTRSISPRYLSSGILRDSSSSPQWVARSAPHYCSSAPHTPTTPRASSLVLGLPAHGVRQNSFASICRCLSRPSSPSSP
eukprot:08870_1